MSNTQEKKWISILDEEPAAGQGVLIVLNTGVILIGYRKLKKNSHDWQLFGPLEIFGIVAEEDYVTHWMELPQPPDFQRGSSELYKYPSNYRKNQRT
jgi:hypothetical protein